MMDFMDEAIAEAKKAAQMGEVPIGAVVIRDGKIITRAHNLREKKQSAVAHAEVLAISAACKKLKSWRLDDCDLYVTLEPCIMCAGAILNARVRAVYIGALDNKITKYGVQAIEEDRRFDIYKNNSLNWSTDVRLDLRDECSEIIKNFFRAGRNKN